MTEIGPKGGNITAAPHFPQRKCYADHSGGDTMRRIPNMVGFIPSCSFHIAKRPDHLDVRPSVAQTFPFPKSRYAMLYDTKIEFRFTAS